MKTNLKTTELELAAAAVGATCGLVIVRRIEHVRRAAIRALTEGARLVNKILESEGVVIEEVAEDPTSPIRPPRR
jgi:hypothetical protein